MSIWKAIGESWLGPKYLADAAAANSLVRTVRLVVAVEATVFEPFCGVRLAALAEILHFSENGTLAVTW